MKANICVLSAERYIRKKKGVIRFLQKEDLFYEDRYANTTRYLPRSESWRHVWPLWLINSGYIFKVRQYFPKGSVLLELGCAVGVAYFGHRYQMVGLDISNSALVENSKIYRYSIQADVENIPLPENSMDGVISSYFWEHIPHDKKPLLLSEFHRILKPGGHIIFLYDVESQNPLIRWMKRRDYSLYRKLFIDGDGHFGYESIDKNRELFETHGFKIEKHYGMERTFVQSPSVFVKLSHYQGFFPLIGRILSYVRRPPLYYFYILILRTVDSTFGRLSPIDMQE